MTNQILSVEGMTCDHCAQSVKDAVNGLSGISRVEVDLENKSVTVEFDEAQTKIECIADKITEVGFDIKN
ncbi:MAG TPA: copper ion binding protein [Nitrospinaceae bacterium]|jgi:copper chaperone|nr:copper ion binding protein [Nitrospinaceae bacterium]|tara:strand:+ start:59 stop:268 length:210 start_codon:yes stop_codon:yes gene_type:complete